LTWLGMVWLGLKWLGIWHKYSTAEKK
jgi:hypothetical protein